MFDTPQLGAIGFRQTAESSLEPDPERMLQNAREQREKIEQDLAAFESMDNYYFPKHEEVVLMLYGSIHRALHGAKQAEEYWLNQIDEE